MLRKVSFLALLAGLVLYSTGCDIIYRMLDKEGAEEKELIGEVIPYEKNPTVLEIQSLLKIYGYDAGKADGILGRRTRDAIQRFQKDNQLNESRVVDDETWAKLRVFLDNKLIVELQLNITLIQTLLGMAGYDPGPVDGNLGPKTLEAVKKFQRDKGLKVDGKIGYQTLTALSAYLPQETNP
jgi:peptidoglycan hydrolase-like protein with peptidoglycan-binding domain